MVKRIDKIAAGLRDPPTKTPTKKVPHDTAIIRLEYRPGGLDNAQAKRCYYKHGDFASDRPGRLEHKDAAAHPYIDRLLTNRT